MITITLPLEYFLEILLNNPPSFFPTRYQSILPGAQDIPPGMCRIEVGALLRELDPEGKRVKVFLFEETRHAEVWDLQTWLESTTCRIQSKIRQEKEGHESLERDEQFEQQRKRTEKLFSILDNYLPRREARLFAERIIANNKDKWPEIKALIERTYGVKIEDEI